MIIIKNSGYLLFMDILWAFALATVKVIQCARPSGFCFSSISKSPSYGNTLSERRRCLDLQCLRKIFLLKASAYLISEDPRRQMQYQMLFSAQLLFEIEVYFKFEMMSHCKKSLSF